MLVFFLYFQSPTCHSKSHKRRGSFLERTGEGDGSNSLKRTYVEGGTYKTNMDE